MVNALIEDLLTPSNLAELNHLVGFFKQLHGFHGFDVIYLSRSSLVETHRTNMPDFLSNRSVSEDSLTADEVYKRLRSEKYVKEIPELIKTSPTSRIKDIAARLDEILYATMKTDHQDAGLWIFLTIYSFWLEAKNRKAVIVLPRPQLVAHFCSLLVEEKRAEIGTVADDLELWFFSHFPDVRISLPFFMDFRPEIERFFLARHDAAKLRELRLDIGKDPVTVDEVSHREQRIEQALDCGGLLLEQVKRVFSREVTNVLPQLATSNKRSMYRERVKWYHSDLMSEIMSPTLDDDRFNPCFILDEVYPRQLVEGIAPIADDLIRSRISFDKAAYQTIDRANQKFEWRVAQGS